MHELFKRLNRSTEILCVGEKWWGLVDASVGREVMGEKWLVLVDASSKYMAQITMFF